MNIPRFTDEMSQAFLQDFAEKIKLQGEYRKAFLERFARNNRGETNIDLAKKIWPDESKKTNYDQKITTSLKNATDQIKKTYTEIDNLIPEKTEGSKGRNKKGESDWEIIYDWLWNKKYIEFCETQISSPFPTTEETITLDQSIFKNMLDAQRKLTANALINENFEASKLYVSLGLVESKKQERRKDVSPEMGSRLYRPEEYEITRQFENDEFLTEVLLQGNSPKSQGKRIAIIGEPGSGKTTRLQQIADRLFNENDENLVIWVSLADLQGKKLEDFLLNTWLKIALKQKEASEESQNELIAKFNEGNVWLLLDGLDEMRLDQNPLHWVNSQIHKINGWIGSAKIILTCRVNVWESENNYLSDFDVYKNLPFSEPQRDEFIYKWFTERNLADQLITELNRDGKERIRDLVKNPLRLTLVCYSWKNHQGSLPETKAGLYQECVEAFYLWKEVQLKKTIAQRKQLNQALGELAKQALEQNSSRFRLTKSFICEVLGESDEGLFKLALDLGWLNRVGVAEENPSEDVYAFFHPSFQEYFAALAINDWTFFLNHNNDNPDPFKNYNNKPCVYRVFENKWREVITIWMGLSDQKEIFIQNLTNFNIDIEHFYYYHHFAYSLATIFSLECRKSDICNEVIDETLEFAMNSSIFGLYYYTNFDFHTTLERAGIDNLLASFQKMLKKFKANNKEVTLNTILRILRGLFYKYHDNKNFILTSIDLLYDKNNDIKWMAYEGLCRSYVSFENYDKEIVNHKLFIINNHKLSKQIIRFVCNEIDEFLKVNKSFEFSIFNDKLSKWYRVESLDQNKTTFVLDSASENLCLKLFFSGHLRSLFYGSSFFAFDEPLAGSSFCNTFFDNLLDLSCLDTQDFIFKTFKIQKIYEIDFNLIDLNSNAVTTEPEVIYPEESYSDEDYFSEEQDFEENHLQTERTISIIEAIEGSIRLFEIDDPHYLSVSYDAVDDLLNGYIPDHLDHLDVFIEFENHSKLCLYSVVISNVKKYFTKNNLTHHPNVFDTANDLLGYVAKNMTYPEFYKAWHSQPEIIHPEILEISPLGNTSITETLNQQILDLSSQLQPTEKTYPLIINAQSLEDETDNSSIAQELCNQIYAIAVPDETNIPEINNAPQLKRLIPNIKQQIETKNLALIFHNGEPNETLIKFCKKLSDSIYIKWITEQPIKDGIPPQENLVNILQNWINQLD